jgi:hypothetical protein
MLISSSFIQKGTFQVPFAIACRDSNLGPPDYKTNDLLPEFNTNEK